MLVDCTYKSDQKNLKKSILFDTNLMKFILIFLFIVDKIILFNLNRCWGIAVINQTKKKLGKKNQSKTNKLFIDFF